MPPTSKIAVIQLAMTPLDMDTNFSRASSYVRSAASQGAKLAVLPEYHLTGWYPEKQGWASCCARERWEVFLKKYQTLAREEKICIVPGTIVQKREDEAEGELDEGLNNVAYFIDDRGEILGTYNKKNLWHPERSYLQSSAREPHVAFDTPLGKAGLLICWDLCFPEAFRELIAQGAKLIIIPTYWVIPDCSTQGLGWNPNSEALFVQSALTCRAFENTCAVVMANAGGPPGSGFLGLSQVTVPFVGPLALLGSSPEGMLLVDLDMEILELAESNYRVRADLARKDWHYDYRHSISQTKDGSADSTQEVDPKSSLA